MARVLKSVITSDMEGRIETFNRGAEELFGYKAEEVIGKKRVSLFSPGLTVLEHVPKWLTQASQNGEYVTQTVFINRKGEPIAAKIRITPTFKDGKQIGYCGVTEPLSGVDPSSFAPHISPMTRVFAWMVITRAPFLTAIIVPILLGAAWVANQNLVVPFPTGLFWLTLFAGIFMHIAANTFNDYFDWRSGTDQANNNYFLPFSGGSRSIELGLINEKTLFLVASISLAISAALGLALTLVQGVGILVFGLIGAFSAYFYTAPPLRLAARRGLGELFVGMNFGPLSVAGTVFALTGSVNWLDFVVGLPVGLLTTAILWINQFPDAEADQATGKLNLVVTLGRKRARWGYLLLLVIAFGLVLYGVAASLLPVGSLLILGGIPLAVYACWILMRQYQERSLVRANSTTIQLQLLSGLLMATGILFSVQIVRFLGG